MNGMMNELSEDMAKGQGEALTTYAVVLGVAPEDRGHHRRRRPHQHPRRAQVRRTPCQVRHSGLKLTSRPPAPSRGGLLIPIGFIEK